MGVISKGQIHFQAATGTLSWQEGTTPRTPQHTSRGCYRDMHSTVILDTDIFGYFLDMVCKILHAN